MGVWPSCHWRGIIQQLMEAETETQTLGGVQGSYRGGEGSVGNKRVKDTMGRPTQSIDRGSQGLIETESTTRKAAWG